MSDWVGGPIIGMSRRKRPMKITQFVAGAAVIVLVAATVPAIAASIPKDQLDKKKIYWGNDENFSKPASVDYTHLIKVTPEFKKIKNDKIERGSGKYWILVSQASDRVVKALAYVGEKSDYDLICANGYLKNLDPPVASDDLSETVIKAMEKLMGD